ncbi:hypothetical protein MTO96_023277 [Rhipicephalus appendiculatus]
MITGIVCLKGCRVIRRRSSFKCDSTRGFRRFVTGQICNQDERTFVFWKTFFCLLLFLDAVRCRHSPTNSLYCRSLARAVVSHFRFTMAIIVSLPTCSSARS